MTEEHTPAHVPGRYSKLSDFLFSESVYRARLRGTPGVPRITLPALDKPTRRMIAQETRGDRETLIPPIASLEIETPIPADLSLEMETPRPLYAVNLQLREDLSEIETLKHPAARVASSLPTGRRQHTQGDEKVGVQEQQAKHERSGAGWRDVHYLHQFVTPLRWLIGLTFLLTSGATLAALPLPFILRALLDEAFPRRDVSLFCWLLLGLLAIFLLEELLRFFARCALGVLGRAANLSITYRFYRHLLYLPLSFHDGLAGTGQLPDQFNEITSAQQTLIQIIPGGATSLAAAIIYLSVLILTDWRLTLATLATASLYAIINIPFHHRARRLDAPVLEGYAAMSGALYEGLFSLKTIKALAAEHRFGRVVKRLIVHVNQLSARRTLVQAKVHLTIGIAQTLCILIVLCYGGYLVFIDALTVGQLAAFALLLRALAAPLSSLQDLYQQIPAALTTIRRFCIVLNRPAETDTGQGIALSKIRGQVTMRHLHFSYEPGQEVLHDINLDIPAGATVAIVGKNALEKTALANLLLRFYSPDYGIVRIDECDLCDIQVETLRRQCGVLLQGEALFSGTIEENLTFGLPHKASLQEMVEAARNAGILDFILQQPSGFKTVLKEHEQRLSIGQRQRFAIARMFLRQPALLLIEEPLSALDDESEALVQEALRLLRHGRTTFILAHRLSTLRDADRIIVLDDGWLAEQGTHEELLARRGAYWRLYTSHERL